jgi:hypothetical protein
MEGTTEGMGMHWKDGALIALIGSYRISDTSYYFPHQNMTVRFIDGAWYLKTVEISREHVAEIYSTEIYFEEDEEDEE